MATGDSAAAVGMDVVPSTADVKEGYEEINKTRDYLADHETTGTHDWSKITNQPARVTGAADSINPASVASGYPATKVGTSALGFPTSVEGALGLLAAEIDAIPTPTDTQVADTVSGAAYARTVSGGGFFQMWMDNGLRIGRNVSSIRYKDAVEVAHLEPADVLALEAVTYHRIGSPDEDREFGLIAEQVNDHVPELVTWYADEIDGVRYDLLAVALLSVVQAQDARIADLERRMDEGTS